MIFLTMNEKTLNTRQNSPEAIELLTAMRQSYENGKRFRLIRVLITVSIPILSIFIMKFNPNLKELLALVSSIWLVLSRLYFINFEKQCIKTGAMLQEEFDTRLFEIPWNKILVGEQISPKERILLSKSFKGDRAKLKNWYPGLDESDENLNYLLCQRTSVEWEVELRKFYINKILLPMSIISTFTVILIFFQLNISFQTFILSVIVPSLPLILHVVDTLNAHKNQISSQKKILSSIDDLINRFETYTDLQVEKFLREYQNAIFMKRIETNVIPSKIYWLKRNVYDEVAKSINENLSKPKK